VRAADQAPSPPKAVGLAPTDPANPYGAPLDWRDTGGHRPGRKAGASVVLVNGALVLYLERVGKTLLQFGDDHLGPAATALHAVLQRAGTGKLAIATVNGDPLVNSPLASHLVEAGFYTAPNAIRYRA